MESSSTSGAEELPPALPIKQHRVSVESDSCALLSPGGLNDVFFEPRDCLATQCPIHQRYDSSQHQQRFFSDRTPPPVPRKKFVRALSFPATSLSLQCPQSPLSPLLNNPQNFDNPLYMMAPLPNQRFHRCTEELQPARKSTPCWSSFSQLTFDSPDEHLSLMLSTCGDQSAIWQVIQQCQLFFLRNLSQTIESKILLRGDVGDNHPLSYQPCDFLLKSDSHPTETGDNVYHCLQSHRFPGRMLALKVHNHATDNPPNHQPPHVNVQNTVAHFRPGIDVSNCTAAYPPGGGSTEYPTDSADAPTTVECFLLKGLTVSVERDLPQATLENLAQERNLVQGSEGLDWGNMVCVLLLQILLGSQHLYNTGVTADLRPQNILLVWEMNQGLEISIVKDKSQGIVQRLWRTHGSPRVVIGPQPSDLVAPSSLISQISSLIKYFLDAQSTCPDSDQSLVQNSCQKVLLDLYCLLQNDNNRPQLTEMVVTLQVHLWGPHFSLDKDRQSAAASVHNWLTVKQALLLTRLAERGLSPEKPALDWEQCMCLKYLSFTNPETIMDVISQT